MRMAALDARERIQDWVRRTPLEFSPLLSGLSGAEVWLKLENWQQSRSFKIRGAANKILSLSPEEQARGLTLSSSGNHAAACVHVASKLNLPAHCVLPSTVSQAKLADLEASGLELTFHGEDCVEAEMAAKQAAEDQGRVWISPYNDAAVIAGQGTVGLEIEEDLSDLQAVLVPVGGGGLISGVAGVFKGGAGGVEIVGCQPEASCVMARSVAQGRLIAMPSRPTLSDGTAGGVEPGSVTWDYCRRWVDGWVLLEEAEIAQALRLLIIEHRLMVEGAAALPVAALLKEKKQFRNRKIVLVVTGARINIETLKQVFFGEEKS